MKAQETTKHAIIKAFMLSMFIILILLFKTPITLAYTTYHYYANNDNYNNLPIISGPYPRGFLWHTDFSIDDFNHYDEFIGYEDLDLFYPEQGIIEVYHNPYSEPLDLSGLPEGMQIFGYHVQGLLPGGGIYRKHYHHEHPWDYEEYWRHNYDYFSSFWKYQNKPVYKHPCQSISTCEYRKCCW